MRLVERVEKEMKKRSVSHDLGGGTFPSPGAPHYRGSTSTAGAGSSLFQKGWASERVAAGGARQMGSAMAAATAAATVTTFSSGRAVPWKWEDAERWICSPLNPANSNNRSLSAAQHHPQKRPKSKSGPIVHTNPSAITTSSTAYSAAAAAAAATSVPFSAGSAGVGPFSGLACGSPDWPHLKDTNFCCPSPKELAQQTTLSRESNDDEVICWAVSQRDMATQMSPKDCRCSQSSIAAGRPSSAASSPTAMLSLMREHQQQQQKPRQQSDHFGKLEVRDVEVDKGATMIRWSRRRGGIRRMSSSSSKKGSRHHELGDNGYDISQDNSKWEREEAKITAWENLQKAKAEAAVRKLEMKLEKKRSATMDKIVDKLRTAEFKAHKMRNKLSDDHIENRDPYRHVPRLTTTTRKLFSFRKHVLVGSLSRLFICRTF